MTEELTECPVCKEKPWPMRVGFGQSFIYECSCGIGIPFPPAQTEESARRKWNEYHAKPLCDEAHADHSPDKD